MTKYWRTAPLALRSGEGALHGKGTALCSMPGREVKQEPPPGTSLLLSCVKTLLVHPPVQ